MESNIKATSRTNTPVRTLALDAGRTFSKEQLYEAAFGFDGTADASAVTEHIKNIRAKLRAFALQPIETVWGIGYRWKNE